MKKTALLCFATLALQLRLFANFGPPVLDTLIVEVGTVAGVSCFGNSDGAISLNVQGTPPLTFTWSNGDTLQNIANLTAGSYDVTVTDSALVQVVLAGIEVEQPDELLLGFAAGELPTCNGQLGALSVVASGGVPDYTFEWSNGATESSIDSLVAGIYEVTATDANGCTATLSIDLQPNFPNAVLTASGNITCDQPTVLLDGSGSDAGSNLTFEWSASNGGQFAAGTDSLVTATDAAGTYTLTVTDTLTGCSATATVDVAADTLSPIADAGPDTTVACTNSVVSLAGNATNGTSFSYLWTTTDGGSIASGETTATPVTDHAGTFILTVTNLENGCKAADTVAVIGLNEPPSASVLGGSLTCLTTEITLGVDADTTGRTFGWTGPNSFISNELNPVVADAGEYTFTLTDTLTTCSDDFVATVADNTAPPSLAVSGGTLTCAATSLALNASTNSGDAAFLWAGPNFFVSDEQNPTVFAEGSYDLLLTDTLTGCTASASATVATDTLAPSASAGPDGLLNCFAPSLQLDGSASSQGDHFNYLWATPDGHFAEGENTLTPTVDAPGTYTLTVTDTLNGCSATDVALVAADLTAPTVEATGGEVSCFEPSVQVFGSFDPQDVSFGWAGPEGFVSASQNPIVTLDGDYTLTVTDTLNGCSASAIATVTRLGIDPELTTTGGTLTCAETSLQVTVEANIGGIIWSWASDNGFTSTEQNPTVTEPGIYSVLGLDTVFGCIALDTAYVEIDTLSPAANAGAGLAFNCNVTSAVLNGTASAGPEFSYLWTTLDGNISEGETTLTPTVTATGTYTLTVTSAANGCSATSSVTISQTPPVTAAIEVEDVTCHGTPTGAALVTPGGGSSNYTIIWSSGETSATASGLVAGTYSVTVTDTDGCTAEATAEVSQPDILFANVSATGQSLAGIDDGTASANPTGGTPPFGYFWENGGTEQTITDLAPGDYSVVVIDANGCTAIGTANVNEFPCVLTSSISGTATNCFGEASGTATVVLENAVAPLHFEWSNDDSLQTVTGLVAGIYTVTVSDSTNCENVLSVEIGQPSALTITEVFHQDLACPDDASGFSIVGTNGGVQPYQFNWSNGGTALVINNLTLGSYTLSLTDANGCLAVFNTEITATDDEAPQVALQDVTLVLDENGQANLTAAMLDDGTTDNCGDVSLSIDVAHFDCSHLGEQVVTVTAIDGNGNQNMGLAIVTISDEQAPVLFCEANMTVSECVTAVEFALPSIEDNCAVDPGQLQQTAGLPSGSTFPLGTTVQTFQYTDAAGNAGGCSFEITVVETLQVGVVITDASCAGNCDGSIGLTLSGGVQPYGVAWSNGGTEPVLTGLCAGSYTGTVTDAGGCETDVTVVISGPAPFELAILSIENLVCASDPTGSASVEATGGTAPYTFLWPNGETGGTIANLPVGIYEVNASDANGCQDALLVELVALDNEAPVLLLQDLVFSLSANGSVALDPANFDAGSSDNCGIANWAISPASLGCADLGENTVTLTATDANGNAATGTATVTIVDNIAPSLACPANVTVGFCNPAVMFLAPQVTDNCAVIAANLQQTAGLPSGSVFPNGTSTQAFSYTDASGNAGTCSFTVTVFEVAGLTAQASAISCAGECDGEITLAVAGPASPFSILWSNGQTGPTATGLCAGLISATVTDAVGCLQTFTTTISAPPALTVTTDDVENDVNGAGLGSIDISVSGGTSPYTYVWTKNGQPFSATTQDLDGLTAGTYALMVLDANGCEIASGNITVENVMTATDEPVWAEGLALQPNPAKDWSLLVLANQAPGALEVSLLDFSGKAVRSFFLKNGETSQTLALEGLPSGVYSVLLRSEGQVAIRRLVIGR